MGLELQQQQRQRQHARRAPPAVRLAPSPCKHAQGVPAHRGPLPPKGNAISTTVRSHADHKFCEVAGHVGRLKWAAHLSLRDGRTASHKQCEGSASGGQRDIHYATEPRG
jgi:hypothetical protein